jgi:hypothetical protein
MKCPNVPEVIMPAFWVGSGGLWWLEAVEAVGTPVARGGLAWSATAQIFS